MNIRFTIIIFFFIPVLGKSQSFQIDKPAFPIDSLEKVLPLLHDSSMVDCLNEMSRSHLEEMTAIHFDSALVFASQAYKEAASINYIKGLGDACLRFGVLYRWHPFDFPKMEKFFREAISWYKKIENDGGLGHAFKGLGDALLQQDSPDEAKAAFEQSVSYFRKTGNRIMQAELIDEFGSVYGAKSDFEKQFEYVKKGFREKKRIGDQRGILWSLYRLAYIYRSAGDYETALDYLRQSLQQAHNQGIQWNMYRSMGTVFFNLKNYDSSYYYFQKMYAIDKLLASAIVGMGKISSLRIEHDKALREFQKGLITYRETGNLHGKSEVLAEIGKTYAEMKQNMSALHYAKESLSIATQLNAKDIIQDNYEIHWNVYEALEQKDSAYFYYRKFVILKDSLEGGRLKLQHLQKLALYKVETKEEQQLARIDLLNKDNQVKQQQLQKESLMKKVLTGSLAVLVLLSIIILRNIALKRKNEKHRRELAENELKIQKLQSERIKAELLQQKAELEMQALRAQMNPHFIFNSLNSINSFIFKNKRTEATEYLTKFSRLIRMILHSSASSTVSLAEDLAALQLYMELESLRVEQKFDFKIEYDPNVDPDFIHVPPMLLQPYVENAIWHGLMLKKEKGNLWVNISHEASFLICTVTDNGIGRKKAGEFKSLSANEHKSMGMGITAGRIALLHQQKQLESSVQITDLVFPDGSPGGTEVVIKIPVNCD